jgi:small subunit ribosomal protein S1
MTELDNTEHIEQTPAADVQETVTAEKKVKAAHDSFDWTMGKRALTVYDENTQQSLEKTYLDTFKTIKENEIIKGRVESISSADVVLALGSKSDGIVSFSEFRDNPNLKVGDEVEVYVVTKEDDKGQMILSRKNAKQLRAWESIVTAFQEGTVVQGVVNSKTKGGLIVDVYGLETFLPGSQIDVRPIVDYDAYVGKKMEFKVVKVNDVIKNAVVSHKALIESDIEEQKQRIIATLEKGQVLEGVVKNITDFGAFIDLGGVDGLLYITDISWGRITHPAEVLQLNQKLNVVVIDFDDAKKRISLGLKQLQPQPWEVLGDDIKEGSVVKGRIVNVEDYGAFLEITPGVEGLIHVSEVTWSNQPINAREYFTLHGDCTAKIVTLDRAERKMSLSIKQLQSDPWDDIENRYPIGSRHAGEVKNITPYGVFIELSEGIGGMVHISDLSWTRRFNHPSEYTRPGEKLDIVILGIDKESRKLSLGHKQIEEDPWDTFSSVFPVGSEHKGTIIKRDDKGAVIQLPYGLEAFAPNKHLRRDDGGVFAAEDEILVQIVEFDRNEKRIIVSYTEAEKTRRNASTEKQQQEDSKAIADTNAANNQSTLGDIDALAKLKENLDNNAE